VLARINLGEHGSGIDVSLCSGVKATASPSYPRSRNAFPLALRLRTRTICKTRSPWDSRRRASCARRARWRFVLLRRAARVQFPASTVPARRRSRPVPRRRQHEDHRRKSDDRAVAFGEEYVARVDLLNWNGNRVRMREELRAIFVVRERSAALHVLHGALVAGNRLAQPQHGGYRANLPRCGPRVEPQRDSVALLTDMLPTPPTALPVTEARRTFQLLG
jgi:hypothetical protein